ncbi:helix-turn-helix domain-containing protein [Embleya sp. NPDC008237]|uniref:helix-turn-helix domain-containing protein n=1 Tax=Embleya sp. NPDC008237 TaxID=3363978 RepID=UPI0036EFF2A3
MTASMPRQVFRLRFKEFVVDPADPDVTCRELDLHADLLTFEDGTTTFWLEGVEMCDFPSALLGSVELIPVPDTNTNVRKRTASADEAAGKAYSVEEIRKRHGNAYQRWTPEDEQLLLELHAAGHGIDELARRFDRQPSAIRSRLGKLGVPE